MVGDARFTRQWDGDHFDGLIVVKRLEDEAMEIFDADGGTAVRGGVDVRAILGLIGQVVS